ncbi:MAG: hypothetical protein M3Q68_01410 [Actinomycetota bacterium]|nr:hypothetical protein [Actinomycetota bacterium]
MDAQRELDAVVAHGLLNSLAVISGSAATMLEHGSALAVADVEMLTTAIDEQSEVFTDGLQLIVRQASDAFADAATAVSLAAGVARHADGAGQHLALEALVRRTVLLRQVLDGLVRGLPAEVISLLDDGRR